MGLKRGWFQNEFLNYKKSWEPAWLVKKVSSRVTLELFWEKNRKTVGRDGWFLLTPALNRVKEHLENLYGTCECCVRNMWGQCFLRRFGDFSINLSITIENLKEYRIYCHHYPHRVLTMHPHVCSLHSHTPHTVLTGSFRFPQTVKSRLINSREVGGGQKWGWFSGYGEEVKF